jgi:hypothetical protein
MSCKVCPRCGVTILDDEVVVFSFSTKPQTTTTLSSKVCQWAYSQDLREGKISPAGRPSGCINPHYDPLAAYPNPLDDEPVIPAPPPEEM